MSDKKRVLQMKFSPDWVFIKYLWEYLRDLFREEIENDLISQGQATSVIELLENAIKYYDKDSSDTKISLLIVFNREERVIEVEVENQADDYNIDVLKKEFDEVSKSKPDKFFIDRLLKPDKAEKHGAQLGLARVIYEGKGKLSLNIKDNVVKVNAIFNYSN